MPQLCFYFQLHQPYRLGEYTLFELGRSHEYFSFENKTIFKKVAKKSYLPMLQLLLELLLEVKEFRFTLSLSGVFVEQALEYEPKIIRLLQQLIATGRVELLAETYYHSLASLFSFSEFRYQVNQHTQLMEKVFGVTPEVFRNTELVYSNHIAELVAGLGFIGQLTEAVPRYLGQRPKTQIYRSFSRSPLPLLLKHAELSDDIAFRFSDKNWDDYPLTADKYLKWLADYSQEEIINLFMDFETFGEHQWEDTGIFSFFAEVVKRVAQDPWSGFVTPTQVFRQRFRPNALRSQPAVTTADELYAYARNKGQFKKIPVYDVPEPISWADVDRDLTAWVDNELQQDTVRQLYDLEKRILATADTTLINDWRRLQTSDHFYYMCIKWSADGDVHAYFSPYDSPLEAYRRYCIALADVQGRLAQLSQVESEAINLLH